jgi:23S rRNA (cytosine1962-C5)-methyltransferase
MPKTGKLLNLFSYSGGFSVYAFAAGAREVVSVDSAASAIELANQNVKLNGFD